jgi:hypothetical protein
MVPRGGRFQFTYVIDIVDLLADFALNYQQSYQQFFMQNATFGSTT